MWAVILAVVRIGRERVHHVKQAESLFHIWDGFFCLYPCKIKPHRTVDMSIYRQLSSRVKVHFSVQIVVEIWAFNLWMSHLIRGFELRR